uniref:Protein MON2 homolog isoform X2 n=1 Tax=Rhizophora mucronata TaxID=61149 RepID=A0A2P2MTR9_RHIMU
MTPILTRNCISLKEKERKIAIRVQFHQGQAQESHPTVSEQCYDYDESACELLFLLEYLVLFHAIHLLMKLQPTAMITK